MDYLITFLIGFLIGAYVFRDLMRSVAEWRLMELAQLYRHEEVANRQLSGLVKRQQAELDRLWEAIEDGETWRLRRERVED